MPLYETESIVLRSYNLAEADRIVVLYTRDHGLIRGVAKGARRLKSKFGSSLEPFCEVRAEYFRKDERELVSIQNVDLIRSSFAAASDPELLQTYAFIADLLLEFTPPHDPNGILYRMLRACIEAEITEPQQHEALKLYFETWLMRLGGYLPDWSVCSICRRQLLDLETANLLSAFRLVCGTCSRSNNIEAVSPPERRMLRTAQQLAPGEFVASAADDFASIREVRSILARIISTSSGREVKGAVRGERGSYPR